MTFTDHMITLRDGRTLAVSETGDRHGRPVLFCHPAPGSRLLDPDPATTARAGIRLIGFDRAGYGRSTALPRSPPPTIPIFADDAKEALDALGLDQVDVVGWSAGGRIALALDARHPSRVRSLCVVATPAPNDEVRWMPDGYVAITKMLQRQPENAVAAMAEQLAGMAADPAAAVDAVGAGPAEKAALAADPARLDRLRAMLVETFRQGPEGIAADIVSYTVVPLGYSPAEVRAPTSLLYSAQDAVVGPAHGDWHAAQIPGARLRVVEDGGHLVAITEWAAILEMLVA